MSTASNAECDLVFGGFFVFWCDFKILSTNDVNFDHNRPYFQLTSHISKKASKYSIFRAQRSIVYTYNAWPNVINTKCESVVGIVTVLTLLELLQLYFSYFLFIVRLNFRRLQICLLTLSMRCILHIQFINCEKSVDALRLLHGSTFCCPLFLYFLFISNGSEKKKKEERR